MSRRRELPARRGATILSSVSASLPIIGATRAAVDTDRMPLLFDEMAFVAARKVRQTKADFGRGRHQTPPDDSALGYPPGELRLRQPAAHGDPPAPMSSPAEPMLLTVRQVEATLQLGRTRTYELLRSGEIPVRRIGRLIRVSRSALEEWAARNDEPPARGLA
jgi:excisionase family DNA binding protein